MLARAKASARLAKSRSGEDDGIHASPTTGYLSACLWVSWSLRGGGEESPQQTPWQRRGDGRYSTMGTPGPSRLVPEDWL